MKTTPIRIYEKDKLLSFTYDDLIDYHNGEFPGGVALVYKLMVWVFNEVVSEIPHRESCSFYSGIGMNGKGIIDGADLVMQIRRTGQLNTDLDHCSEVSAPPGPGGGKYYFEIGFNGKLIKVKVKKNVIPEEFFSFSKYLHEQNNQGKSISKEEMQRAMQLRTALAELILKSRGEDIFTVIT